MATLEIVTRVEWHGLSFFMSPGWPRWPAFRIPDSRRDKRFCIQARDVLPGCRSSLNDFKSSLLHQFDK